MYARGAVAVVAVLALGGCAGAKPGAQKSMPPPALGPAHVKDVDPAAFCVTCGALATQSDGRTLVESPKMRAVVDLATGNMVDLHFTYLGPTRQLMALSSGLSRTQVGLKLFAHDACNLVYVMWRLHPEPGIVVSTKRNAGLSSSPGCGNRGYNNIRAHKQAAAPPVAVGIPHRLRVERNGADLNVYADETLVWQGTLQATQPDDLMGLTGIRSDNGRFILKLQLSEDVQRSTWAGAKPACLATPPAQTSPSEEP